LIAATIFAQVIFCHAEDIKPKRLSPLVIEVVALGDEDRAPTWADVIPVRLEPLPEGVK
jgi:hypothetical protein